MYDRFHRVPGAIRTPGSRTWVARLFQQVKIKLNHPCVNLYADALSFAESEDLY